MARKWAFEAIYSPLRTEFVQAVESADMPLMTGADLLLFQAIDAFEVFTGQATDPEAIRPDVDAWFAARES